MVSLILRRSEMNLGHSRVKQLTVQPDQDFNFNLSTSTLFTWVILSKNISTSMSLNLLTLRNGG